MAGEFDRLTESDKLRSFVDTSGFREQLAESNSKIFDTELKSLQLDEARMDLTEKGKVNAANDIDREDKSKARDYAIKFAESSFNATTVGEIDKAARDFISKNPGSGVYVRKAVDDRIKSLSDRTTLETQGLELEKQKELQALEIDAAKSKSRFDKINYDVQQRDQRIKDQLESDSVVDVVETLNSSMPKAYENEMGAIIRQVSDPSLDLEARKKIASSALQRFGKISKAYKVAEVATVNLIKDNSNTLRALYPDLSPSAAMEDLKKLTPEERLAKLNALAMDDGDARFQLDEFSRDLEDIIDLSTLDDQLAILNAGPPNDATIAQKTAVSTRLSEKADRVLASRETEWKDLSQKLKLKQAEATLKKTEAQTDAAGIRNQFNVLRTLQDSKMREWQTLIRKQADLEKDNAPSKQVNQDVERVTKELAEIQDKMNNFNFNQSSDSNVNAEGTMDD